MNRTLSACTVGCWPNASKADTGVVTPGAGQTLRITVAGGAGADAVTLRFAWTKYMVAGCNPDGICRHTVASHGATTPVTISGDDVASFDVQGSGNGARVVVITNTRDVRVNAQLINANGEA